MFHPELLTNPIPHHSFPPDHLLPCCLAGSHSGVPTGSLSYTWRFSFLLPLTLLWYLSPPVLTFAIIFPWGHFTLCFFWLMVYYIIDSNSSLLCNRIIHPSSCHNLVVDGPHMRLGHVTCFGHWDVHKCDVSRGLKCVVVVGLAFLHFCHYHEK